jgi:predicted  nucleic acid-binding Zn-ribbon protein
VNELNKGVQDIKLEVETIKKTQIETTQEMQNLGKRPETTIVSITKRIQGIEERISGVEDTLEEIKTTAPPNQI